MVWIWLSNLDDVGSWNSSSCIQVIYIPYLGCFLLSALGIIFTRYKIPILYIYFLTYFIIFRYSITYPAISAFVSMQTDADKQGLVQGMITGMRGLCNGLGPAMYGLIFSLFHVDLNENTLPESDTEDDMTHRTMPDLFPAGAGSHRAPPPLNVHNTSTYHASQGDHLDHTYYNIDFSSITTIVPGPPFVFGAFLVMLALMVAAFIPEDERVRCNDSCSVGGSSFKGSNLRRHPSLKGNSAVKAGRKKKSDDSDTDDQDDLLDQIKHQRDLPSDKEDSMEDDDYDYMTTVPLMEGVKDRSLL